jgi:hypothetical protein
VILRHSNPSRRIFHPESKACGVGEAAGETVCVFAVRAMAEGVKVAAEDGVSVDIGAPATPLHPASRNPMSRKTNIMGVIFSTGNA